MLNEALFVAASATFNVRSIVRVIKKLIPSRVSALVKRTLADLGRSKRFTSVKKRTRISNNIWGMSLIISPTEGLKVEDRHTGDAHAATRNFVVVVKTHMFAISLYSIPPSIKQVRLDVEKVPLNRF